MGMLFLIYGSKPTDSPLHSWETRMMSKIPLQRCVTCSCQYPIFSRVHEQIDEGFAEEDLESNLQRDKYARLCNTVNQLIDELTPSAPDFQLRDACEQLVSTDALTR